MAGLAYILDTNVIADRMKQLQPLTSRFRAVAESDSTLYLSHAVNYEVVRGLVKTNATTKLNFFQVEIIDLLEWVALTNADWEQAARFWVEARRKGKQLSDIDLLIAAQAQRLNAILVTNDDDFDALPIRRENWRLALP